MTTTVDGQNAKERKSDSEHDECTNCHLYRGSTHTHTHVHSGSDLIFPLCSRAHNFPSFSVSNGAELRSLLLLNLILLLICFTRVSSHSFADLLSFVCSCKTEELCTTIATCACALVWYSVQDREDHRCHPLVNETATSTCL